jgi:hypothetical protein
MTKQSMETTREWAEHTKRGKDKGMITFWTYKNNVASEPKTRRL